MMNSMSSLQCGFDLLQRRKVWPSPFEFQIVITKEPQTTKKSQRWLKCPGEVRGPAPGWTYFSCHVDGVRDLILHLCHCIKYPSFHVSKIKSALRVRIYEKNSWRLKMDFLLFPLYGNNKKIHRDNFTNWTSFPLPFLLRRRCTWKALGTKLPLVMTLRTFCSNMQLFWSAFTKKLRGPGYDNVKLS